MSWSSNDDGESTLVVGAERSDAPTPGASGDRLGRYLLIAELGRGAMGVVMRAYDPKLQREVALKVVRARGLAGEAHARMVREARAMAKLSHPNVVTVYDVEDAGDDLVVVAMELVEGRTLADWLSEQRRPPQQVVARLVEAGRGLWAAHRVGLLHRDFKPSNVLVGDAGSPGGVRCRVTDFGLARLDDVPPSASLSRAVVRTGSHDVVTTMSGSSVAVDTDFDDALTTEGVVMGTPAYMAPEQQLGRELTAAADQFALCVSLWEGLSGRRPYAGGDLREILAAKLEGPPVWRGPPIPRPMLAAIRRGLAPQPGDRWPTLEPLLDILTQAHAGRLRGRRVVAGVVVVAGMVTVGAMGWLPSEDDEACRGAARELVHAWSESHAMRVREAFVGTALPLAEDTWRSTRAGLDEYAAQWTARHREACEATTLRGERSAAMLDASMACLQRARQALSATVTVLAAADGAVVLRAGELVDALPPLARCGDVERLVATVESAPPELRDEVALVRAKLAQAVALRTAGRFEASLESVAEAASLVEPVEYAPIHVEVDHELGASRVRAGDYEGAVRAHRRALRGALRGGQDEIARRSAVALVYVLGLKQRQEEAAWMATAVARGLLDKSDDVTLRARLLNHTASMRANLGDTDAAIEDHRRALALLREHTGAQSKATADALNNLALALGSIEAYAESQALHREAMAMRAQVLGDNHPDVADSRHNYALSLRQEGRFEEAERELRAALEMARAAMGERHPHLAIYHRNLGLTLHELDRLAEAEAEYRLGIAIQIEAGGSDDPRVADTRGNLASALVGQERLEEAHTQYRLALQGRQHALGTQHPEVAAAHNNLGYIQRLRGDLESAAEHYAVGIQISRESLPHDHPTLVQLVHNLGRLRYEMDDFEHARGLLDEAWAQREHGESRLGRRAETALYLGLSLWELGDHEHALALVRTAREGYLAGGSREDGNRREVEQWLTDHDLPSTLE